MALWKISGATGRWLEFGAGQWTADPATDAEVTGWQLEQAAMPVAFGGPEHQATGRNDPVWLFLAARKCIPGPHTVTGTPPALPAVPTAGEGDVH